MKLFIHNLEFEAILGVLKYERQNPQKIVVDLEFRYNYDKQKKDYIDYTKVAQNIQDTIISGKYKLIEEALIACELSICAIYDIRDLKLKITKPNIMQNCKVGVQL